MTEEEARIKILEMQVEDLKDQLRAERRLNDSLIRKYR